jgi:hypothetical protein
VLESLSSIYPEEIRQRRKIGYENKIVAKLREALYLQHIKLLGEVIDYQIVKLFGELPFSL